MKLVIHADGGCIPNPGEGRCGIVVYDEGGRILAEESKPLGQSTNNVAEWCGLIAALEYVVSQANCSDLTIRMDSRLVVEQINGRMQVKKPHLQQLAAQASTSRRALIDRGCTVRVEWIPRSRNSEADALTRKPPSSAALPELHRSWREHEDIATIRNGAPGRRGEP